MLINVGRIAEKIFNKKKTLNKPATESYEIIKSRTRTVLKILKVKNSKQFFQKIIIIIIIIIITL